MGLVAVWFVVTAATGLVLGSQQVLALQAGVVVAVVVAAAVVVPGVGGGVDTAAAVVAVVMFGMVAVAPTTKFLRSCTILQAALYVSDGIDLVFEVVAWLSLQSFVFVIVVIVEKKIAIIQLLVLSLHC